MLSICASHPQSITPQAALPRSFDSADRRIVCRGTDEIHLTRKEHDVLAVLARHLGRVVTHDRVLAAAWGGEEEPRVEYLRIVIRNLRQKIEAPGPIGSVIANELGVGYRLRAEP